MELLSVTLSVMGAKHYLFVPNPRQLRLNEKIHKKINRNLSGYKWKAQTKRRVAGLVVVIS